MRVNKSYLRLAFACAVALIVLGAVIWQATHPREQKTTSSSTGHPAQRQPGFNKKQHSITEPSSIWIIANKQRNLGDYAPNDLVVPGVGLRLKADAMEMQLRRESGTALEELFAAAKQSQLSLILASGYRSKTFQATVYANNVKQDGQAEADRSSARPGYSEHQTGLAADIGAASRKCEIEACFAETPEGKWLAAHAHEYGFVLRYPNGKESTTGYEYEPWHFRYVGKPLATEIRKTSQTLEQFFSLPAAPNY
jgi:D-alanyl-D-alanine carboxypeptidase